MTHACPAIALLALSSASLALQPTFHGLGPGPWGAGSWAQGISGDGLVVVGEGSDATGNGHGFRWTAAGGFIDLGDLAGGGFHSTAESASFDGACIVGAGEDLHPDLSPVRWCSGPPVPLQTLLGPPRTHGRATSVSADGSIAVGSSQTQENSIPVWWDAAGAVHILPPHGSSTRGIAMGVSADGSIIVGLSGTTKATRWLRAGGTVYLGDLPGGAINSQATAVSADGGTIVGFSSSAVSAPNAAEAFRWTAATGMIGLGGLTSEGAVTSHARDVSRDGSVVVGSSRTDDAGRHAFVWDQHNGMRNLRELLIDAGHDMTGWTLTEAVGVSDNGRVIAGNGKNPAGRSEAWIIQFPAPCPGDCDANGALTVADFGCFRTAYLSSSASADCNDDGSLGVDDFLCFRAAYLAGCP